MNEQEKVLREALDWIDRAARSGGRNRVLVDHKMEIIRAALAAPAPASSREQDMALLINRLARRLELNDPLRVQVREYLKRHGLTSPLRAQIHDTAAPAPAADNISAMVNRFLGWKLPQTFGPDCYITFDKDRAQANHGWPIGTNLLSASEAKEMLEYVLAAAPQPAEPDTVPWPRVSRYSGGASRDGVAGRVWVQLTDGPEEVEYVPAAPAATVQSEAEEPLDARHEARNIGTGPKQTPE